MTKILWLLCLLLQTSCLTPMLWSGSLVSKPVTKQTATRHLELDSLQSGFHLGEPVLLLQFHDLTKKQTSRRKVLLISNHPPSEGSSPLFLVIKPGMKDTLHPSEVSLRIRTLRLADSSERAESLAGVGLRGRASTGPEVVVLQPQDVPRELRTISSMKPREMFEPKVQTLIDRFSNQFQLPGHPEMDDRGSWTPLAWLDRKGEVIEDRDVVQALSRLQGVTAEKSGIVLLGRRLSGREGGFVYCEVGLEYLVVSREIQWTGADGEERWTLLENFRVLPVPEDFELEAKTRRDLPHPDLDFLETEYETTKGAVSDALVTKILLTPVTLFFDAVGFAIWVFFVPEEKKDSVWDHAQEKKSEPKWLKIY